MGGFVVDFSQRACPGGQNTRCRERVRHGENVRSKRLVGMFYRAKRRSPIAGIFFALWVWVLLYMGRAGFGDSLIRVI